MCTCDFELTISFLVVICDKACHLSAATDFKCGIQTGPINVRRVIGEHKLRNIYTNTNLWITLATHISHSKSGHYRFSNIGIT